MTLTLKGYENASLAISRLRAPGQLTLSNKAKQELVNELVSLLLGDGPQKHRSAIEIIDILDKQA